MLCVSACAVKKRRNSTGGIETHVGDDQGHDIYKIN